MSRDLNLVREEDDIGKVELAKEIERTRQLFHNCDGELQTQIDNLLGKVQAKIKELIDLNGAYMEKLDSKFKGTIEIEKDELERILTESTSAYGRKLDEFMASVEKKINDVYIMLSEKIDSNDERNSKTIKNSLDAARKELDLSTTNAIAQLSGNLNNYKRATDLKFGGLDRMAEQKASKEVDRHIANISQTAKRVEDGFESFKKDISDVMTKHQAETMKKVQSIDARFESTRLKFALISDSLKKDDLKK